MATHGTKSGFEIRADLLNQAQCLLELNAQREVDAAHFDLAKAGDEVDGISMPVLEITAEEIVETARKFNAFVNEK